MNANQLTAPMSRDALVDLIASGLSGTYHCARVWDAWNVGTIGRDDFSPVDESETPAELADSILAAIAAPQVQPITDEERQSLIGAAGFLLGSGWSESAAILQRLAAGATVQSVCPTFAVHAGDSKVTLHFSSEAEALEFYRTAKFDVQESDNKTPQAVQPAVPYFSFDECAEFGSQDAAPQAAPAAVAVSDAVRDAEKLLRAEAARLERIYNGYGNKWYGFSNEKAAHIEHLRVADALAATPAAAPDMVSVNKEDANNYCRILTALGMEEDGDPVAEVQSLLAAAAAPVAQTEVTWCEYIAGMIGCYLKEPDESPRVKAIAGIIERRLWALPSPKPVARTDKPASFEAWAKSEGGPFALHNCGPYNRDAMKLAGMAWHASALLATATGLPALTEEALAEKIRSHGAYGGLAAVLMPFIAQHAAPQAQADARDALTPAKPVHPKGMTSINARLSFNLGWVACERHHGIRSEDVEQAVATDAAIAAAKGDTK